MSNTEWVCPVRSMNLLSERSCSLHFRSHKSAFQICHEGLKRLSESMQNRRGLKFKPCERLCVCLKINYKEAKDTKRCAHTYGVDRLCKDKLMMIPHKTTESKFHTSASVDES